MFQSTLNLGNNLLQLAETQNEEGRKKQFLNSQTIVPVSFKDKNAKANREVVINLNTESDKIDIKLGDQLDTRNRNKFFAFELLGSNSKKIYFSTNNFKYHLVTLNGLVRYIKENIDKDFSEFNKYLKQLREKFYRKSDDEKWVWILNPDLLKEDRRREFYKSFDQEKGYTKANVEDTFKELASKDVLGSTRKNFAKNININTLKIDGIRAHEEAFLFQKEYIDIVYHNRQKRFFDSSEKQVREKGICSGCGQQKKVTGKIDIPTKFYITDKPTFFENLEDDNAFKSFALCEDCYQSYMVGIDHMQNNYSGRLFGTNYLLIPKENNIKKLDEKMYFVKDVLAKQIKNLQTELKNHEVLLNEMKHENLSFDFLFHWTPAGQGAAFVIAEHIPNVEFKNVSGVFDAILSFKTGFYSEIDSSVIGLTSIYWLLFPNVASHSNPKPELYRKELLQIFKALLKNGTLSYRTLINKFITIQKKTRYRKQDLDFSFFMRPLQMHMLLKLFHHYTQLKGLNTMNEQNEYTEIPNEEIATFFKTHPEIYDGNAHRQGLVLLGILMNQILKKQKRQKKSATIIEKINFDGMPVSRLPKFINEITEYLNLYTYDLYNVNKLLHAAMMDRVQNIECSSVSKDEVVFYIMTGISLSSYIGYKINQQKQIEEVTNE